MVRCKSCCVSVTSSIIQSRMTNSNDKMNGPGPTCLLLSIILCWVYSWTQFTAQLRESSLVEEKTNNELLAPVLLTLTQALFFLPVKLEWCITISASCHDERVNFCSRTKFHILMFWEQVQMSLFSPIKMSHRNQLEWLNSCKYYWLEQALRALQGSTG